MVIKANRVSLIIMDHRVESIPKESLQLIYTYCVHCKLIS